MNFEKRKLINFLIFIFSIISISFLIYKQIIYPTIIPVVKNGVTHLFADWSVIINANICLEKGFDVYLNNPCDIYGRKHAYGHILLNFPLINNYNNLYFIYFPIFFNVAFLYIVINFFKLDNYVEYITIFPFIFSPSIILAIERANIDVLIFLLTVFVAFNKKILFNYISILFVSLSKFYPIVLISIFIFEKKISKIILNIILILVIFSVILFFEMEELKKIFQNTKQFSADIKGIYSFSFEALTFYLMKLNITINNQNYNWVKYVSFFILLIIPIYLTFKYKFKHILNSSEINNFFLKDEYENRLYLISSLVILFCYFSLSNYLYREIFFLGLIPWILNQKKLNSEKSFINFYYYLLLSKFIISSIIVFLIRNDFIYFGKPILIFVKHCLDFYLISIILLIYFSAIKGFIFKFKRF